ncbi:Nn.00g062030.m01.CDS01 [Neocucurbitaria sp. VM-36]
MEDESIGVKQKTAEFINANFILSYVTIQRMKTTRSPKDVIRLFEDFFFPVWLEGTHPNSWGGEQKIISKTIEKLCNRVPKYGQFVNEFTLVQAMAVLPAMIVELAAQCNPDQLGYMPIPAHIPFSTFMDIPAVFHRTAENFSTCHVREMTTHTFLSGHWQGYYSDQRPFLNARRFHIPMRDIRIVARAASGEGSTRMKTKAIIDRRSRGVDSHGEFSLDGRVCEDGLVHLSKKYIGMGQPWPWSGRMTPFGIIGVWGDSNNFGGYFWISKHEWC